MLFARCWRPSGSCQIEFVLLRSRPNMRIGLSAPIVGVAYLLALAAQLSMNVGLVVTNSAGSRLDLLGFVAMMSIGFVLALHELLRGTLRTRPALLYGAFAVYLSVVIVFTSQTQLLATFLSKYGILTWTLAGAFAALSIDSISRRLATGSGGRGMWPLIALAIPVLMFCILLLQLRDYVASPHPVESYQFAAANLTVLFIATLAAAHYWASPGRKMFFMTQGLLLLGLGTALTYLVSRMNSTSIVLVWALLAPLYLRASGVRLGKVRALLFVSIVLVGLLWALSSGAFAEFLENTRFREIAQGEIMLSSLSNRLALVPTFWSQFAISPVVGHYEAEVLAGYMPGEYVHSMPLSLLTHTGVIGSTIFVAATFSLLRCDTRHDKLEQNEGRALAQAFFYVVLAVATISTFFTWIPMWFMIGFLLVRRRLRVPSRDMVSTEAKPVKAGFS